MKRMFLIVGALLALVVAGVIGYLIARRVAPAETTGTAKSARKVLYWYDAMKPQQHFDHPGISPMGMQMVPRYASGSGASDKGVVKINPTTVENLGVRTTAVKVGRLTHDITVPATVAWNLDQAVTVSARASGVIDTLYVRKPFTLVTAGEPLAELIAPQWSAAAQAYLALGDATSDYAKSLRAAARERLRALGMSKAQIRSLKPGTSGIILRAPTSGVVTALNVREGQQVGSGSPLMTINGLNSVWLKAAIPQEQTAGITAGTPVTATFSSLPGRVFHGKVDQLLPTVDTATRTQQARIVLGNSKHALAPGMFANVRIKETSGAAHPLVPTGAIVSTGTMSRVILALGDGRFKPVAVRVGAAADDMTAIVAGLAGGERVVTSGQFLIDSEASLSGALERLSTPAREGGAARASTSGMSAMPGMSMPVASGTTAAPKADAPNMSGMAMPKAAPRVASPASANSSMPAMSMPASSGSQP